MVLMLLVASSASSAACTTRSDAVSSALVASSRMRIGGSRTTARAMAMRCFCPPDSWIPFSPTCVANASGSSRTNVSAFASRAAASISSLDAPGRPSAMFQPMLPAKSTGSCETRPICCRSQRTSAERMSAPSRRTSPPSTS
mmetsp:Transcript_36866/g.86119  ORF Transcript_36866/g.86119 Transcript_36866/m.86119 type:complete len:142 (-) Transcript_36866:2961-3386(-)